MPSVNLDEETLDKLLLEHLKKSVYTCARESKWQLHPQDREFNAKIFPALLGVIEYFSAPKEYQEFVNELFTTIDNENDDGFDQIEFEFDDEGEQ